MKYFFFLNNLSIYIEVSLLSFMSYKYLLPKQTFYN